MDGFEHPGHNHPLLRFQKHGAVDIKCHGCMSNVPTGYVFYSCQQEGCEYYLDSSCFRLGRYDSKIDHPLHPQHPLTPHFAKSTTFPSDQKLEFVCSFCGKNRTLSGFVFYCGQCDFYLDPFCFLYFELRQLLLKNYEFPYFLHRRENHILSPHLCTKSTAVCQLGCSKGIISEGDLVFKCTSCDYYLHVNCSQVPQQTNHSFHPHHTLTLVQNDHDFGELRCNACYIRIKELSVLRCTECDFCLDIGCSSREATVKSEHHEHPLVHFDEIYNVDVEDILCAVCNTLCDGDLLRCVDCNFNIHPGCRSLPFIVEYYDHVHPLTLTSNSFKEEDNSGQYYYCDICEERRNPHHAVYSCEDCPEFVAHFKCVLPPESIVHLKTSLLHELEYNLDLSNQEIERKGEITTTDKAVLQKAIFSELNMEMAKMGGLVKQLLKKVQSIEVAEEIEKIEESYAKAESMLRKLGETFT